MTRIFFLILLMGMHFFEMLSGQQTTDTYIGFFKNEETQLTLSVEKLEDATFRGALTFQGQTYPYQNGFRLLGVLNATYPYNGNDIAFSLSFENGVYYWISEGLSLPMEKVSDKPVAPSLPKTPVHTGPEATSSASVTAPAAAGTRYNDPYGSYSFQAPAGWTVKEADGAFQLSANAKPVEMGLSAHAYASVEAAEYEITDMVDPSSSTAMKAAKSAYGDHGWFVRYTGRINGSPAVIELITLISPHGGGVTIAAYGKGESFGSEYTQALKTVANSVQFSKPVVSAAAQQWKAKVSGKKLLYLYTGNGYSEKKSYDLCTDGSFTAEGDNSYVSSGFSSDMSAVTASSGDGFWKIISAGNDTQLVLQFNGGGTKAFSLTARSASNEVGMNGERYFITDTDTCR